MPPYQLIKRCTVDNAASLSSNNMSAFWEVQWWNVMWPPQKTLDDLIAATAARFPHRLLSDRETKRHQMVVDTSTGEVVGYARWILPESHQSQWLEALVPDVGAVEKKRFADEYKEADFSHKEGDNLDALVHAGKKRHAPRQPYMDLDYLAVRPSHQHCGVASMLVKSGQEAARTMKLDVLLVAMGSKALGLYLKHGFQLREEQHQSLKDFYGVDGMYDTYILVWEFPKEEAGSGA